MVPTRPAFSLRGPARFRVLRYVARGVPSIVRERVCAVPRVRGNPWVGGVLVRWASGCFLLEVSGVLMLRSCGWSFGHVLPLWGIWRWAGHRVEVLLFGGLRVLSFMLGAKLCPLCVLVGRVSEPLTACVPWREGTFWCARLTCCGEGSWSIRIRVALSVRMLTLLIALV
ncbi:hypothetical protein HNY73_020064 [Argiope bruennichi]|uniref:Uncharacterized protein n=1 Tax=Argiope bruennichi TaxID=94029 RepID=A0A8T0E5E9_ARGBR|nr:hypothetical protein HNY73_020064 [Argiope bruennichi]